MKKKVIAAGHICLDITPIFMGSKVDKLSDLLAPATGASCVAAYDALSGLKSFEELEQKIAAGWRKRDVSKYS